MATFIFATPKRRFTPHSAQVFYAATILIRRYFAPWANTGEDSTMVKKSRTGPPSWPPAEQAASLTFTPFRHTSITARLLLQPSTMPAARSPRSTARYIYISRKAPRHAASADGQQDMASDTGIRIDSQRRASDASSLIKCRQYHRRPRRYYFHEGRIFAATESCILYRRLTSPPEHQRRHRAIVFEL